jgi:hypothetical protein
MACGNCPERAGKQQEDEGTDEQQRTRYGHLPAAVRVRIERAVHQAILSARVSADAR